MGIFDKFKKDKVIDYTDNTKYLYKKRQQSKLSPIQQTQSNSSESPLGFLSDFAQVSKSTQISTLSQNPDFTDLSSIEEPKERLKQRLLNMTSQIEDLSNQIYKLQQRLELLEQKLKTRTEYLG